MSNDLIKNLRRLKELAAGGQPDGDWVAKSRAILMSQIQPQIKENLTASNGIYYWQYFRGRLSLALRPVLAVFLVVACMFGYAATVSMANASLPGDMLYPVKTATEQVQLALTFPESQKVQLQMDFVNRRVDELQQMAVADGNRDETAKKVSSVAKQISKNIKVVKEKLNKITAASISVEVAKNIDTQTLAVGQSLMETAQSLPTDIKSEVAPDIHEAIKSTEDAGTAALGVIVKNYETGQSQITDNEVATRVADRIKNTEDNIAGATTVVNELITGIVETATSTKKVSMAIIKNLDSTSTLEQMVENSQQAQKTINEAKDLLGQKDFTSALVKIQQSKEMVSEVISGATGATESITSNCSALTTTTQALLGNCLSATSTAGTSETTNSLVK